MMAATSWGQTNPDTEGDGGRKATILIYGDSGVGKTLACIRMPGPIAWIAFEGDALESVWARGYRPEFQKARTYADALDAVYGVKAIAEKAAKKGEASPFATVVLDSITSAEDRIVEELVTRGGKGVVQDSRPEVLSQGGYGVLGGRHRAVREAVLQIPGVHKVFIALPKSKGDDGTVSAVVPSISGQQGARFPAYCNWVLFMEAYKQGGRVKRRLRTRHEGVIFAKDRLGVLASEEDGDLAVMLDKGGYLKPEDRWHTRDAGLGDRAASDRDWQKLGEE